MTNLVPKLASLAPEKANLVPEMARELGAQNGQLGGQHNQLGVQIGQVEYQQPFVLHQVHVLHVADQTEFNKNIEKNSVFLRFLHVLLLCE